MENPNFAKVRALADGSRSSIEIAEQVGLSPRYVRRILQRFDLPRLADGGRSGENNHQFVSGRRVGTCGYVLISVPAEYLSGRTRKNRISKVMFEHRFVLEQALGRYLLPSEIVDHKDGLTLHNAPDNLRLFQSNGEHLRETLTGKVPLWSDAGYQNMKIKHLPDVNLVRIDTHHQRKVLGVVRLRQILLLALSLGIDSPYLLGTTRHTTKAGIDMSCRSTIKRALDDLCQQHGFPQIL